MSSLLGTRVGHYQIVKFLGEGGMGAVHVGYDDKLDRKVALKSIHADHRPHPGISQRFLREARVLSQLAHPNICQIYDFIEEDGNDFIVLELIEGRSLAEAIREGLGFRSKLEIARQVADALAAAHEKGIIHRDLKPDNVMLTGKGQVKVLDFGLARLLQDEYLAAPAAVEAPLPIHPGSETATAPGATAESSGKLTLVGAVMGTVQYMSPEQARGVEVSTASDLYSLGLLLQELFTGRPPYPPGLDAGTLKLHAAQGTTLPATGIDRDVAALIDRLKALAPAARPSALDTAERLAWIGRRPLRRRRKALAAGAMALLALFGAVMAVLSFRASRAERRARQEAATARQVSDFMVELFKVSEPGEALGNQVTARELLDRGAQKIASQLVDQPVVQARLMDTMGVVYWRLGLYGQTQPLLETALATREAALGPEHLEVAQTLNNLGLLACDQGRFAAAAPLLQRSLALHEHALGPDHPGVARALNSLANLAWLQGRFDQAEPLYQRSLTIREKALDGNHPDLAESLNNLAILYFRQGRYPQAEPLYRRSLRIWELARGPDHPDVAHGLDNLANLYRIQGRAAEAEPLFRRSLRIREKAFGPDHPEVASTLANLGNLCVDQRRYAEAEPLYQRSLRIRERTAGPDHPQLAHILESLASLYWWQGKIPAAERLYRRSLAINEAALGPEHPQTAQGLGNLAILLYHDHRFAEAETLLRRALGIRERSLGAGHPDVAESCFSLACLNALRGRRGEALAFLRRALPGGAATPWMRAMAKDPDLVSLRGDPEFERIVAEVEAQAPLNRAP
jgi:serine/threonine-protein kinase